MSDNANTPVPGTDAAAGAQARQPVPPINIVAQYVKDLSFENPNAPESLRAGAAAPQVQVNVDVRTNKIDDRNYEVILNVKGEAKGKEDKVNFLFELSYGGLVQLGENTPPQAVGPLLLIEAPRMMFPFARAVIAEATRNGGYPPLLIQPIDFADMFRRQLTALRERQQAQAASANAPAAGSA